MSSPSDPFSLQRFVDAQAASFESALDEIRMGRKRSHWMWYVFPQIAGLGRSDMARRYAVRSLEEARAYLEHPVLGARLRTCVMALQDLKPTSAQTVFGNIDAVKLRSSLTLFAEASDEPMFGTALERWFMGEKDLDTLALLGKLRKP